MRILRRFSETGAGKIPYLSGEKGFYVEFTYRISSNDRDCFPAVWLMPIEHNARKNDQYAGDEKGYERWMEESKGTVPDRTEIPQSFTSK